MSRCFSHILIVAIPVGLLVLALVGQSATWNALLPCMIDTCFGLPCPGCGMLRAMGMIMRGDIVQSFHVHILGGWGVVMAIRVWGRELEKSVEKTNKFNMLQVGRLETLMVLVGFGVQWALSLTHKLWLV